MKQKISITLDAETIETVEALLEDGAFRNRSHAIEFALNKFVEEK